jgi:hypothetical protein
MSHERNTAWSLPNGGRDDISANALTAPSTDNVVYHGQCSNGRRYTATMTSKSLALALDASGASWRLPHGSGAGWRIGPFYLDVVGQEINGFPVPMTVAWDGDAQ